MAKNLARDHDILRATFKFFRVMPRGDATTSNITQAIAGRIDYLHQMLGLQNDAAAKNIRYVKNIQKNDRELEWN